MSENLFDSFPFLEENITSNDELLWETFKDSESSGQAQLFGTENETSVISFEYWDHLHSSQENTLPSSPSSDTYPSFSTPPPSVPESLPTLLCTPSNTQSECVDGGRSILKPSNGMGVDDLLQMGTKEFNKALKELPVDEAVYLKKRRRQLKNCKYATKCRRQKETKQKTLKEEMLMLKEELERARQENAALRQENNDLKQTNLGLSQQCQQHDLSFLTNFSA